MLIGERWGHQLQGVSKQKLCVLWLVAHQGQLQIVQVRLYEGEICRLIRCHKDFSMFIDSISLLIRLLTATFSAPPLKRQYSRSPR
jgi:hypothetical protein